MSIYKRKTKNNVVLYLYNGEYVDLNTAQRDRARRRASEIDRVAQVKSSDWLALKSAIIISMH